MADIEKQSTALELQQQPLSLEKKELASDVLASMARAQVQARYIVAQGKPRDWDVVRQRILADCERPAFAESAMYKKPMGNDTVTGLSIRFAEAAQRAMGNLMPERLLIYDDYAKRIVRLCMTDLESNVTHYKDLILDKTVERKNGKGRKIVSQRMNSYGDIVYIVEATEDELLTKESAISSKIERQLTLKILPGDIQDEAKRAVRETLTKADKADPKAAKNRLIDSFDDLGIRVEDLKEFLVVESLDTVQPKDLKMLREVYTAIKEGETNWREVMEQRNEARGTKAGEPAPSAASTSAGKAKAAASAKAGKGKEAPVPEQTPAQETKPAAESIPPATQQTQDPESRQEQPTEYPEADGERTRPQGLFGGTQAKSGPVAVDQKPKTSPPPLDVDGWT